jgi:probable phosphoglycerate mutase
MNSKRIYFVRHGETDYNLNGKIQGKGIDASLNDTGIAQGNALYQHYKDVPFEILYCSSLKRTRETIQAFISAGLKCTSLAGFDEMSYGDLEGQSIIQNEEYVFTPVREAWDKGNYYAKAPNGESLYEVIDRQKKALQQVLKSDHNPVLVCMHGRAMRILMSWLTGKELRKMDEFNMPNTAVYVVDYDYNSMKYSIIEECLTAHLEESIKIL